MKILVTEKQFQSIIENNMEGLYEQTTGTTRPIDLNSSSQVITVTYYEGKPTINNAPLKIKQTVSGGIVNVPDNSTVELKYSNGKIVKLGKGIHDISKIPTPTSDTPSMFGDFASVFNKPTTPRSETGGIRR